MNKLNEELLSRVSNMELECNDDLTTAVNPDYKQAIEEHEKIDDKIEDDFKELNKQTDEFIKSNEKREVKFTAPKQFKKMKLSESLFEDYGDNLEVDENIVSTLEEMKKVIDKALQINDTEWNKNFLEKLHYSLDDLLSSLENDVSGLNESSENLDEALTYDEPTLMGKGCTAPLVDDYSNDINQLVKVFNEGEADFAKPALTRIVKRLFDNKQSVENFNGYWEERYPAAIEFINKQLELIPQTLHNEMFNSDVESFPESVEEVEIENKPEVTEDYDGYVYKTKREPLADIIQDELTIGEEVYKRGKNGNLNPLRAPALNLSTHDIGIDEDENGYYIIANVADEATALKVEEIGKKYGKETKVIQNKFSKRTPFSTKIYISLDDFDEPYEDSRVVTRKTLAAAI